MASHEFGNPGLREPSPLIVHWRWLVVGGLLGVALYWIHPPFFLLAERSPFYRARFYGTLRLRRDLAGAVNSDRDADHMPALDAQLATMAKES